MLDVSYFTEKETDLCCADERSHIFPVTVEYVTLFLSDHFMFLNYRCSLKSWISFLSILYLFSLKQLTFADQNRDIMEVKSNSHYYIFPCWNLCHTKITCKYVWEDMMWDYQKHLWIIRSVLVTVCTGFSVQSNKLNEWERKIIEIKSKSIGWTRGC